MLIYRIAILFVILFSLNIASAEEKLKTISAEEFIAQNPSPERKAIVNFIIHQFDDKREQNFTQKDIDKIWSNLENGKILLSYRFQIVNQQLYTDGYDFTHKGFQSFRKFLEILIKKYKIPDVDFIVFMIDGINGPEKNKKKTLNFPSFIMSKDLNDPYEKDKILIPDNFLIINYWKDLIFQIKQANESYSWENKIDRVFWRGATTGTATTKYSMDNFNNLPRLSLAMLSKLYPDLIDAKFSSYHRVVFRENSKKIMSLIEDDFQKVSEVDHLKYKYLISIDGNTCAWRRIPWVLLSNSVLVKQETNKIEWFYPAIKPYVHYVPVDERLMDIIPQIQWMKGHDEELKQISKNATNFIENNLMPEHIEAHMVLILNEYHKLHKGEEITPTLSEDTKEIPMYRLMQILFSRTKNQFIWWVESFF